MLDSVTVVGQFEFSPIDRHLGIAEWRGHIVGMTPLEKCKQTLSILIKEGDAHKVELAERAIEEYLAASGDPNHQTGALNVLDGELVTNLQKLAASESFLRVIQGYIEKRIADIKREADRA